MGYTDEKCMQTPINVLGCLQKAGCFLYALGLESAQERERSRETLRCVMQIQIHFLPNMENFSSGPCK